MNFHPEKRLVSSCRCGYLLPRLHSRIARNEAYMACECHSERVPSTHGPSRDELSFVAHPCLPRCMNVASGLPACGEALGKAFMAVVYALRRLSTICPRDHDHDRCPRPKMNRAYAILYVAMSFGCQGKCSNPTCVGNDGVSTGSDWWAVQNKILVRGYLAGTGTPSG